MNVFDRGDQYTLHIIIWYNKQFENFMHDKKSKNECTRV